MAAIYIIRRVADDGVTFFAHDFGDKKASGWLERGGWSHADAMTLTYDEANRVLDMYSDAERVRVV